MRQKPKGSTPRLRYSGQILEVVAICDPIQRSQVQIQHHCCIGETIGKLRHAALSRQIKRSGNQSGDQRSQNMCEKSSRKHILKLAQKNPVQHKFQLFEMCRAVLCPGPQRPVKASSAFKGSLVAPAPADQTRSAQSWRLCWGRPVAASSGFGGLRCCP